MSLLALYVPRDSSFISTHFFVLSLDAWVTVLSNIPLSYYVIFYYIILYYFILYYIIYYIILYYILLIIDYQ